MNGKQDCFRRQHDGSSFCKNLTCVTLINNVLHTRLVIGTSRIVGSAKKFVRITSGFGGGEFTKTLRKVCTCQKLKVSFLLLEYCKIRECYAVANAFTIRNMYSLFLYIKCNSRKINRPTKNMTKIAIYIEMFFCKESMSVPFSSFP
jgi:hypothetical protein